MKLAPLLLLSVLLSVASAAEILINWSIPFGQPALPPAYVTEGDTLLFRWDGPIPHNVLISPAGNCDLSSAILLGQESGVRYTFQARDVGEMTFACGVPGHCQSGQILKVFIRAMPQPTPAPPTPAPPP